MNSSKYQNKAIGLIHLLGAGEVLDRYSILKIQKDKRILDNLVFKQFSILVKQIKLPRKSSWINYFYKINKKIWSLEIKIYTEHKKQSDFSKIGKMAIEIRKLNKIRNKVKLKLNKKFKNGYLTEKINYG